MKVTTKLTQRVDIQNEEQEMIQCFMISELRAQDISCAFYICLLEILKMNWIWVYIVWAQKLVIMHILVITGLPFMDIRLAA